MLTVLIWVLTATGLALSLLALSVRPTWPSALRSLARARYSFLVLTAGSLLWIDEWLKYFGSISGQSSDPSQTAVVLATGAHPAPSLVALGAIVVGFVFAAGVRRRRRDREP